MEGCGILHSSGERVRRFSEKTTGKETGMNIRYGYAMMGMCMFAMQSFSAR